MNKKLFAFAVASFFLAVPSVYATSTINYAWMFSENRQYDPAVYSFPEYHPWYNGQNWWFMMGLADVSGDTTHPVHLNSQPTGDYEMYYNAEWGPFEDFSIGAFFIWNSPVWGGPFSSPGSAWEDQTYTFSIDGTTTDSYIPGGSLNQLDIPQVTISGSVHPTISWTPVENADYYHLIITPIDENGLPDLLTGLFVDLNIQNTFYNYTGDIFSDGNSYGVWVRAAEKHPYSDPSHELYDPKYDNDYVYLNRSSFITQHTAPIPEPASMLLLGSGLIGLAGLSRRFRR